MTSSRLKLVNPIKFHLNRKKKHLTLADTERKDDVVVGGQSKTSENLTGEEGSVELSAETKKTIKRKIVKKVVKGKAVGKKAIIAGADSIAKQEVNMDMQNENTENKHGNSDKVDTISTDLQSPATMTTTIVTKGTLDKSPLMEDKANSSEGRTDGKTKNESTIMDGTEVVKKEHDGGSSGHGAEVKIPGKRKITRRVIKSVIK